MKEKATIYDLVRFCDSHNGNCCKCELGDKRRVGYSCVWVLCNHTDEANKIILNWCKEHPVKTRQDKFLEMFPNARMYKNKYVNICPKSVDQMFKCNCNATECTDCRKSYWLAEVKE